MINKNENQNENLNKFYDTLDNVIKTCKTDGKQETLASTTTPPQTTATTATVGTVTAESNYNTQYGWVCPKCGKVNAPWKDSCNCYLNVPYMPPNTPSPAPFNPMPSWPQTPEIGDAPGWWQYGPSCTTPIPCVITATDKINFSTSVTNDSKIPSGPIYRTFQDSKISEPVNDIDGLKDNINTKLDG